jgi:molecular chaperone IbpA
MTRITSLDLTPFYRNSVGFNQLFDRITNNIIRTGDELYTVEIAAAGFVKADVKIEMENSTLTVTGNQPKKVDGEDEANGIEYLHKGISQRNFVRTFNLAEHVKVTGATMNDGVLRINLEKIVPEALKPKTIEIK